MYRWCKKQSQLVILSQKEIDHEIENFEKLRIAILAQSVVNRGVLKRAIMTIPYGLRRQGANEMVTQKLTASVSHVDLKPVAFYLTRMLLNSVNQTFVNAMHIRQWLTRYNVYLTAIGLQMEWLSPIGLPVTQIAYKSKLAGRTAEEVLLAARDLNVLVNQKQNVYGHYPDVNYNRAQNGISPNFVHSIDAVHAMLTSISMNRKGWQNKKAGVGELNNFLSVHDCYWTHACNVSDMNILLRDAFVDIYTKHVRYILT